MEFSFEINSLLSDEITILDRNALKNKLPEAYNKEYQYHYKSQSGFKLKTIIDRLGEASAKAQGLLSPITSALKLVQSSHKLYIIKDANSQNGLGSAVGFVKVGHKSLFLHNPQGSLIETYPLCVLDFYIHESRQRLGLGHELFNFMLKSEAVCSHELALDRPSHKLLAFMAKHYSLSNIISQVNNFVVFSAFFTGVDDCGIEEKKKRTVQFRDQSNINRQRSSIEEYQQRDFTMPEYSRFYYSPQTRIKNQHKRLSLPPLSSNSCPQEESSSWKVLGVPPPDYLR